MSLDAPLRPRPLSPHLAIYRLTSTLAQYLAEDGVKYDVVEHPFTGDSFGECQGKPHLALAWLQHYSFNWGLNDIDSDQELRKFVRKLQQSACLGLISLRCAGPRSLYGSKPPPGSADRSARLTS